jgi:hypothetical protein
MVHFPLTTPDIIVALRFLSGQASMAYPEERADLLSVRDHQVVPEVPQVVIHAIRVVAAPFIIEIFDRGVGVEHDHIHDTQLQPHDGAIYKMSALVFGF